MTTQARAQLNSVVIGAEMTLISIIQGAALHALSGASIEPIVHLQYEYWLYTLSGLLIICIVWSRSLLHIFTMIRWPLEFGHNFFYILLAFLETLMFNQLGNVGNWFFLGIVFWALAWIIFAFDMRMIHTLQKEKHGPRFGKLLDITEREQRLNIRLVLPLATLFHAACFFVIGTWPDLLLDRRAHIACGFLQLTGLLAYQIYSLSFYGKIAPLILASREELNGEEVSVSFQA